MDETAQNVYCWTAGSQTAGETWHGETCHVLHVKTQAASQVLLAKKAEAQKVIQKEGKDIRMITMLKNNFKNVS